MISSLRRSFSKKQDKRQTAWERLVVAAASGEKVGDSAVEDAAPSGLTGIAIIDAFESDVATVNQVNELTARAESCLAKAAKIDPVKIQADLEKCRARIRDLEQTAAQHRHLLLAASMAGGDADRLKYAAGRLFPDCTNEETPAPQTPAKPADDGEAYWEN